MAPELDQFFHHNPPASDKLLRVLFVGRDWELKKIEERIPGSPDTPGIRAVHGNSRVGKSHLAMRALLDLDRSKYHYFRLKAAGGRTAKLLLRELYNGLRKTIFNISDPVDLPEGVSSRGLLLEAKEVIQQFDQLVNGEESQRKLVYARSFEQTAAFSILAKLFGLESGLSASAKQGGAETIERTLAAPDEWGISDMIAEMVSVLSHTTNKASVIYVDDIDLLESAGATDQQQVALLVRILEKFSEAADVTVVASLRTRNFHAEDKGLVEVVFVEPLNEEDLKSAYRKHIELFNEGKELFDADCLEKLADFASGQIGNFLRLCRTFYDWADKRGYTDRRLEVKDFERYLQLTISKLAAQTPEYRAYIEAIKNAVRNGLTSVSLDSAVLATPLVFTILQEPLGAASTSDYDIRPLAAQAIRSMA